jgi:hypothetical protein
MQTPVPGPAGGYAGVATSIEDQPGNGVAYVGPELLVAFLQRAYQLNGVALALKVPGYMVGQGRPFVTPQSDFHETPPPC